MLGAHRAGRGGQPEALLALICVLLAFDKDDSVALQGRTHDVSQVVGDGLDTIETIDISAVGVWPGLPEVLVLLAAVAVFALAAGVVLLASGRWREPKRIVHDELTVGRLVVVHLGQAHTPLGLFAAVTASTFAVLAEEIGSTDAPLLQRRQYFVVVLTDVAPEQSFAVLCLLDIEALIMVVMGGAESLVVAVVLLHTLETAKNTVDRSIAFHGHFSDGNGSWS
jgi:hypothetical protein